MDLKKFEAVVREYGRRQKKKRPQRVLKIKDIIATPEEIRKFAKSRGYTEVVFE